MNATSPDENQEQELGDNGGPNQHAASGAASTITIDGEVFDVSRYRRNYYCCVRGCGRTGKLILAVNNTLFNRSPAPQDKLIQLVVLCEKCGRQWRPSYLARQGLLHRERASGA